MRLITMDELKAGMTASILLAFALLLTSCATIRANRAETARLQALADRATTAAGLSPITVVLGPGTTGVYQVQTREVVIGEATPNKEWLLAHELSHYLLHHSGYVLSQEIEANANAVRLLVLWGRTETDAVADVERILLGIAKRGSLVTGNGHNWCAEYRDVVRRYPNVSEPSDGPARCPLTAAR